MSNYLNNKEAIASTSLQDRWKYYIAREYFKDIPIKETGETLMSSENLMDLSVRIMPIWDDDSDLEGQAYREYLKTNSLAGWVRQSVGQKLGTVAKEFQKYDLSLVLRAGFRPLQVQQMTFDAIVNELILSNPSKSKAEVIEMARDYISDPSQIVPPHTAGAAVDVILLDVDGKELDMGCPMNSDGEIAWCDTDLISQGAKTNRKLLRDAMLGVGFAPLGSEWWHYSYGDQIWAAFYEKPNALYGIYDKK